MFSACDVFIFSFDVFIFLWVLYVRGETLFFLFLFLVSHVLHWLLIYIMRLFTIYVFYFMFL